MYCNWFPLPARTSVFDNVVSIDVSSNVVPVNNKLSSASYPKQSAVLTKNFFI